MAQIHQWPKSSMSKAQGWTDEDWGLWKAGVWASWWPSKEEWYDHTKSEQPAEPEGRPPKKPKTEEIQEEIHDEVPENTAEPSPGQVECKMEPEVGALNKQLAAAIAQHQGIFVIFSIPFHFVMYVLWQYCFSMFFNTTLFVIVNQGPAQQHHGPIPSWQNQQMTQQLQQAQQVPQQPDAQAMGSTTPATRNLIMDSSFIVCLFFFKKNIMSVICIFLKGMMFVRMCMFDSTTIPLKVPA